MPLSGHLWTVWPRVADRGLRAKSVAWSAEVRDPHLGSVSLCGQLSTVPDSDTVLVCVHGLGGDAESPYMVGAALAAKQRGWSSLRLNLRGADRSGADLHHAGLTEDLVAAIASPEIVRHRRIFLLGFSLGGHAVLRYSSEAPVVAAIAAICPPLDLARGSAAIDRPWAWLYRHHVLRGLLEIHQACARRRTMPASEAEMRAISSIRAWDTAAVVPRFGFDSVDHYYASMSAAGRLGDLKVPTLIVHSEADPMVPWDSVRDFLDGSRKNLTTRSTKRGGHVGFPSDLDLGLGQSLGMMGQVMDWLERTTALTR